MTTTKKIVFISIGAVLLVSFFISWFKWIKPAMDKKREEKRLLETKVLTKAQTKAPSVPDTVVDTLIKKSTDSGTGFGESATN